jgi:hypothetical protein
MREKRFVDQNQKSWAEFEQASQKKSIPMSLRDWY